MCSSDLSIAHDLGVRLGTQGVLAFLERTASCGFQLAESITLEELAEQQQAGTFAPILADRGLAHLPTVTLESAELIKFWGQGKRLPLSQISLTPTDPNLNGFVNVMGEARCLGVGEIQQIEGEYLLVSQTVIL